MKPDTQTANSPPPPMLLTARIDPSDRLASMPWRGRDCAHSSVAEWTRVFLTELYTFECALFTDILDSALSADASRRDLFAGFTNMNFAVREASFQEGRFCPGPGLEWEAMEEAFDLHCRKESAWRERVDSQGNPYWISVYVPESRGNDKKRAQREGVLPERAVPSTDRDEERGDARQPATGGGWKRFFGGLSAGMSDREAHLTPAERERLGLGVLPPVKPRPMRSLLRMLVVTACLAVAYHFLARRGWVPPIF